MSVTLDDISECASLEASVTLQRGDSQVVVPVVLTNHWGITYYTSIPRGKISPVRSVVDHAAGVVAVDAFSFTGLEADELVARMGLSTFEQILRANFVVWGDQLLCDADMLPVLEPRIWGAERNAWIILATASPVHPCPTAYPQFALTNFVAAQDALTKLCDAANGTLHSDTVIGVEVPDDEEVLVRHRSLALSPPSASKRQIASIIAGTSQVKPFDAARAKAELLSQLKSMGWARSTDIEGATFKLSDIHSLRVVFDESVLLGQVYSAAAILLVSYPAIGFHEVLTRIALDDWRQVESFIEDLSRSLPDCAEDNDCGTDFVFVDQNFLCLD